MGLIAVSMLGIFDMGLININNAGKSTKVVLSVKEKADIDIIEKTGVEENITVLLPGNIEIPIKGKIIESKEQIDNNGREFKIQTFISD